MSEKVTASKARTEPTTILGDNNRILAAKRVTFDVSDGTVHHIDVPLKDFNAAKVQALIEAELETINKIKDAFP